MLDCSEWKIYRFRNLANGMEYYGQDKSGHRIEDHLWCAEANCPDTGCRGTSKLHKALRCFGIDSFEIEIIEVGFSSKNEINQVEDSYIKSYSLWPTGYNSRTNEDRSGFGSCADSRYERILDYIPVSENAAFMGMMKAVDEEEAYE